MRAPSTPPPTSPSAGALLLPLLLACAGGPTPAAKPGAAPPAPDAAPTQPAPAGDPLRIGWQTTWATQGQLAAVLQHTDILARHGFQATFTGFSYGGPLNEGALGGNIDVGFTADQPALSLAAAAPRFGVIGRLMYNRVGLLVPLDSPVKTAADLRGKTVVLPFGAAAHREALFALEAAGLDPKADLSLQNLALEEIVALAGAGAQAGRWGAIDAAGAWDPAYGNLQVEGKARSVHEATVTSVVFMNRDYATAHPGAEDRLLASLEEAWGVVRARRAEADAWFSEAAGVKFNQAVLDDAAAVEPNMRAGEPVRVRLNEDDVRNIEKAATFMAGAGLLKAPIDVSQVIRPGAREAIPAPSAPVPAAPK